jgi:hypothetical protein
LVDLAPSPQPAHTARCWSTSKRWTKPIQPEDSGFSGVVFKVQANMDANHRDRIAFVRVASGKYTPGMKLKVQRSAKELRPTSRGDFSEPTPRSGGRGLMQATSSASPPTAACNWATPSPTALTCNSQACPSLHPSCS